MRNKNITFFLLILLLLPTITNVKANLISTKPSEQIFTGITFSIKSTILFPGITQPPAVFDLFNNDTNYILVITDGTLHCVRISGSNLLELWNISSSPNALFIVSPAAADFDGDGVNEIALIDYLGTVYFVDPTDGSLIKTVNTAIAPLNISGNMAVFDENGDGYLDVVYLANSLIVIVSINGEVITRNIAPVNTDAILGVHLVDLNNTKVSYVTYSSGTNIIGFSDLLGTKSISVGSQIKLFGSMGNFTVDNINVTPYEIPIVTSDNDIMFVAFTKTGLESQAIRYSFKIDGINNSKIPPITIDFDSDGLDEIFIQHMNGSSYFIGVDGIEKSILLDSNLTSSPIICNIDNDAYLDIILTLENGTVLALDYDSITIIMNALNIPRWPISADIDNDGLDEVLLVSRDGLEVYEVSSAQNLHWPTYLHDVRRTAFYSTPNDADGDGISDDDELQYGTEIKDSDSDDDGLNDFAELFSIGTDPTNNDTDSDGLPDGWEYTYGLNATNWDTDGDGVSDANEDLDNDNITNINEFGNNTDPLSIDTDGDGLSDYEEIEKFNTSPIDPDTDNDGMPDGWEIQYGLNPLNSTDGDLDEDNDGVINLFEYGNGTSPIDPDTDNDDMPDGWEIQYGLNPLSALDRDYDGDKDNLTNILEFKIGTDPTNNDTDSDGLPDGWEYTYGLSPLDPSDNDTDLDGDGLSNIAEYKYGTNPRSLDTDNDGMPDGWEIQYGLNPLRKDNYLDPDSDGLGNGAEYKYGTNPLDPDTDGDGILDGTEALVYLTNPLSNDTDGDGLSDLSEITLGTNPLDPDTDGDGVSDYNELMRGTDPLDPTNGIANAAFLGLLSIIALALLITLIAPVIRGRKE